MGRLPVSHHFLPCPLSAPWLLACRGSGAGWQPTPWAEVRAMFLGGEG